jgi:hypothetical protein
MTTFDSGKEGLQDLLNDIHSGKLQLPDFQRWWVLDDHIRSLLASVSLSYSIGAILMMETGCPDGCLKPRLVEDVQFTQSPRLTTSHHRWTAAGHLSLSSTTLR